MSDKMRGTANHGITQLLINERPITIQNMIELHIFEGLTNPAVTGYAILADREAILEKREILPGDKIEIEFTSKADKTDTFSYKGIITGANGKTKLDSTFPITEISFCSEWWFNATTKQISKCYKNKTWAEIIQDLINNECNGNLTAISPNVDKKIERYVSPYWTPAHIIKSLMNGAHNNPNETGYIIYENIKRNNTNIISLDYLFQGQWGIHPSTLVVGSQNKLYEGNVTNIMMESYFDSAKYINQGTHQTDFISFDYDRTKVYTSSESFDKIDLTHLSGFAPIPKKYNDPIFKSIRKHWGPFHQQKRRTPKEFQNYIDGNRNDHYCQLFSDMLKFNVLVPGATNRSAGQLVKLEYPSINTKETPTERHKFLEGYYLIREINHIFKNDVYGQALTLCRDGFGKLDRNDLVRWNKVSTANANEED